jgi:hypothetical protein
MGLNLAGAWVVVGWHVWEERGAQRRSVSNDHDSKAGLATMQKSERVRAFVWQV